MNKTMIFEGIGGISDSHIDEFADIEKKKLPVSRKLAVWLIPAAACVCIAIGIVLILKHSGTIIKDDTGLSVLTSEPKILYSVAVTAEKSIYDINDSIPLTIHVGTGGISEYVDKMEIWSESEHVRLKGEDPLILTAENGDFKGIWFEFDKSVLYKEDKTVEDLPYQLPIELVVYKADENVLGHIDITVRQSGIGFSQGKTVTLYYSIRGTRIAFSTVSAQDADDLFK